MLEVVKNCDIIITVITKKFRGDKFMNIGTNIYTLRKEKKITQAQLAEKLGVSEQAISKWENDQCAPDVSLFPIIAEFFGVLITLEDDFSARQRVKKTEILLGTLKTHRP